MTTQTLDTKAIMAEWGEEMNVAIYPKTEGQSMSEFMLSSFGIPEASADELPDGEPGESFMIAFEG
jgi:hypothetical protein